MHDIAGALIILSHEIIPQTYLEIYMEQYNWVITRYVVSDTCLITKFLMRRTEMITNDSNGTRTWREQQLPGLVHHLCNFKEIDPDLHHDAMPSSVSHAPCLLRVLVSLLVLM